MIKNTHLELVTKAQRRVSLLVSVLQISLWFSFLLFNMMIELPFYFLPIQILIQSFLSVGLFIVAHDCMHGLVGPKEGIWNSLLGRLSSFLFAGFSYSKLKSKHDEHHNFLVSDKDPDYTAGNNENFVVWMSNFIGNYFGLREFLLLHIHVVSLYLLGGSFLKVLLFFALPSWIASLQLFYFGTYKPHKDFSTVQGDEIKARSNNYPVWLSFLTCYHFGYHKEHHKYPYLSWWRLPQAYKRDKITYLEESI